MIKSKRLKELRDVLFAMRSLNMDFGVSEESIFDEVAYLLKNGLIDETEYVSFHQYFDEKQRGD